MILVLIGFLAISVYVNKSIEEKGEVDPSKLTFFYETYDKNREQFRQLSASLKKQFKNVETSRLIVQSKMDSDLSIDTVYIPAQNEAKKIIIMSSGIHGVEGFTGSAVQQYFMNEILDSDVLKNMGVLLIHAINPYGFKYGRRVSENNIDMNRNFDVNKDLFVRKNEGYAKIYQFLTPQKEVKAGYFRNSFFFIKTVYYILKYKMQALRQSTLQGQYEFRNGIFYGGNDFEEQKEWLERLISEKTRDYKYVFVIDIHTGYGERGKLHFLPGNVQNENRKTLLKTMFGDYKIDYPKTGGKFYIVTGGFRDYIGNLIPAEKNYIKIAFEFGTLNSQTTLGSIRSLHNMILEN